MRTASGASPRFPLAHGDELLGVLALFSRRTMSDTEAQTIEVAARHASLALMALRSSADTAATKRTRRSRVETPMSMEDVATAEFRTLAEIERDAIERVLAHTGGRVSGPRGAALILGLKPTTLASRMLKLGVRRTKPSPTL
jgi:transcriptional regulator with GAF, ATPase, and Fis domain